MGFNVVSLANNHIWDLGLDGLRNTIKHLNDNGILYCGAGMNLEDASRPAVIEKDGVSVAFYACCMYNSPWLGYVELAGKDKPGINPLDIDRVVSDIKRAKSQYDKVVVLPHWGKEYTYTPLPECVAWARQMVAAGADAILGSHTHSAQPFIKLSGTPVCFSMGNFLFPDFYMYPPRPIWYPGSEVDRLKIKDVSNYPFPIHEPVRQIYDPIGRMGRLFSVTIHGESMSFEPLYVRNSNSNILSLTSLLGREQKRLKKEYFLIKYPLLNNMAGVARKVKKMEGKNK